MQCNAMDDLRWHAPHAIPRTIRYMYNVTIHWFGYGLDCEQSDVRAWAAKPRDKGADRASPREAIRASTKNRKQLCGIYSHLTLNAGDGPGIKEATDHSNGSRLLIII